MRQKPYRKMLRKSAAARNALCLLTPATTNRSADQNN
jgi:hypothetical protein